MGFKSVTVTRSYEQVVQQVGDAIQRGALPRGQKLPPERELADSFKVSRGVVREAVKVLTAMGLVESRQGSGTFVRDDLRPAITRAFTLSVAPEEHAIGRLFEFRQALEELAARRAAERRSERQSAAIGSAAAATEAAAIANDIDAFGDADAAFHVAVREAADNPYLTVMLGAVRELQDDVVDLFARLTGSMAVAATQHCRVAAAIDTRDPAAAAAAMAEHVGYTAETVAQVIERAAAGHAMQEGGSTHDGQHGQ